MPSPGYVPLFAENEDGEEGEYTPRDPDGNTSISASSSPEKTKNSVDSSFNSQTPRTQRSRWEIELSDLQAEEDRITQRLTDLDNFWSARQQDIENARLDLQSRRVAAHMEMEIMHRPVEEISKAGPIGGWERLDFVEKPMFMILGTCVIMVNAIVMALELSGDHASAFWWLDQVFLLWYVVELSLRGTYHGMSLLSGPIRTVWWNWLDLIVVICGIVDQWVVPLLAEEGERPNMSMARALRLLRLVRIMRIIKICRLCLHADMRWVEGPKFQSFIMCVIGLNAVTMGLELDFPWPVWAYLEHAMLVIYTIELLARIMYVGPSFFYNKDMKWNCLDFVIVCGAIVDQWLMPCIRLIQLLISPHAHHGVGGRSQLMTLLRMVRLLRVLRLVRLLHSIKPLYKLLMGVLEAMQGMKWVLVLAMVVLYAFAILSTTLVGHGMLFKDGKVPEDAQGLFVNVPQSMFLLFKVMNDDQSVMDPLLSSVGIKLLFVVFMVVSNWAILAILTAVISGNMISCTQRHEEAEMAKEAKKERDDATWELKEIYAESDSNGDKLIDEAEFKDMLEDADKRERLCKAAKLNHKDLLDLFDYLCVYDDKRQSNLIHYETFIESICSEGQLVSERSVYRLEKKVSILETKLSRRLDEADVIVQRLVDRRRQMNGGGRIRVK